MDSIDNVGVRLVADNLHRGISRNIHCPRADVEIERGRLLYPAQKLTGCFRDESLHRRLVLVMCVQETLGQLDHLTPIARDPRQTDMIVAEHVKGSFHAVRIGTRLQRIE